MARRSFWLRRACAARYTCTRSPSRAYSTRAARAAKSALSRVQGLSAAERVRLLPAQPRALDIFSERCASAQPASELPRKVCNPAVPSLAAGKDLANTEPQAAPPLAGCRPGVHSRHLSKHGPARARAPKAVPGYAEPSSWLQQLHVCGLRPHTAACLCGGPSAAAIAAARNAEP